MNRFLAGLRYVEDNLLKRFTVADVARAAGYSAYHYCRLFHSLTGKPFDVVVKETLFDPLGIADVEWIRFPGGQPVAGWGLRLRPRDLAKIGQLVLAKGAWQGKRIVSAAWIEQATALHMNGEGLYFYGYKFWLGRSSRGGRSIGRPASAGADSVCSWCRARTSSSSSMPGSMTR